MSEDILARIVELGQKASELVAKGHLLRAAEYHGRAADTARALGDDNLVLVSSLLSKVWALGSYWTTFFSGVPGQEESSHSFAAVKEGITLLSESVASLERRRVAGTLLEGKCTELEESWFEVPEHCRKGLTGAELRSLAKLVGYEQYLRAAVQATPYLSITLHRGAVSNMQAQQFVRHLVQALELMQLPRRHNDKPLPFEAKLYEGLCLATAHAGALLGEPRLLQVLTDAKQRLERSGVLQLRKIGEQSRAPPAGSQSIADFEAAVVNSMAAPGLRHCALASCGAKEAHPSHYKACAACRGVVYCCKEHQQQHWPSHKAACKAARKEAVGTERRRVKCPWR